MKPLTQIYWTRAGLGLLIGVLCGFYVFLSVTTELTSFYTLLTGTSFALLFYIITYYLIKIKFLAKVEKQSKLLTQGIGIYFFAWLVSWTLIITFLMSSVSVNVYNASGNLVAGQELWVVAWNSAGQPVRNITTASGSLHFGLMPPDTYTFQLGNTTGYNVTNQNQTLPIDWLQSLNVDFNVTQVP